MKNQWIREDILKETTPAPTPAQPVEEKPVKKEKK
jgi:hypothetical protein